MSVKRVINVMNQVALGMAAVHESGVVHGDLKPENLILETRKDRRKFLKKVSLIEDQEAFYDRLKIFDFGIAQRLRVESPALHMNPIRVSGREAGIGGTPEYISPEAARG